MARTGPRRCDADHRSGGARIPKDGGGERQLGIPNVLDRLIQQAISQVLTLIFDPGFSESSFGFRPGRSAHGAAKRLRVDGRRLTVRTSPLPLTLNHRPSTINFQKQPTEEGSPQGGPLSPLLSNILLDDLDKELERRGLKFVRYADDFVIFVRSERSAQCVFTSVQRFLTRRLKLVVNEQKSSVRPARGCEFLGFAFVGSRVTVMVAPKKLKTFKRRIKKLIGRSRGARWSAV